MRHTLVKFNNPIQNNDTIVGALLSSAQEFNLDVKEMVTHFFHEPEGVTAILLLGESHFSIHTFYEENMAMVDIFTCNPETDVKGVLRHFANLCEASITDIVELDRS